jgi:hypothetical protein
MLLAIAARPCRRLERSEVLEAGVVDAHLVVGSRPPNVHDAASRTTSAGPYVCRACTVRVGGVQEIQTGA